MRARFLDAIAKRELAYAFAQITIGRTKSAETIGNWIDRNTTHVARISTYANEMIAVDTNAKGKIIGLRSVLAPAKLTHVGN